MKTVPVRRHVRRRYVNRHRPTRNYENLVEVNRRLQHISPSKTLRRITEYDQTMMELGVEPRDPRVLHSYIQAIALHIAGNLEWRHSLLDAAMRDDSLDMTDKHLLEDAVREMLENERELRGQR